MDADVIKKMIAIMDEHKLAELEYQEGERKVRLRKAEGPGMVIPMPAPAYAAHPVPTGVGTVAAPAGNGGAPPALPENVAKVASPMVGTFYRAPKPDADPFVNVGDRVTADKVLCIIEAMKVMNEIKAETEGIVKEVLVKNGQAVEFGEPMFLIEKT